jgi:hypothetical protein
MVGQKIGGVNVFGGGLPLYNSAHKLIGAIGVSGDTSCTDHVVAWKVRDALKLDFVPDGPVNHTDNMVHDISHNAFNDLVSASGWGHPECEDVEALIVPALPTDFPYGPNP